MVSRGHAIHFVCPRYLFLSDSPVIKILLSHDEKGEQSIVSLTFPTVGKPRETVLQPMGNTS